MNIFVLDEDIKLAAQAHCDTHCSKMILESAQMLSTASHVAKGKLKLFTKPNGKRGCKVISTTLSSIYKPDLRHVYHPCTEWAYSSRDCFEWLVEFALASNGEKIYRTNKSHASAEIVKACAKFAKLLPDNGFTNFAQAMPDKFKSKSAVKAYRDYYIEDKAYLLTYTRRQPPAWLRKHFVWEDM